MHTRKTTLCRYAAVALLIIMVAAFTLYIVAFNFWPLWILGPLVWLTEFIGFGIFCVLHPIAIRALQDERSSAYPLIYTAMGTAIAFMVAGIWSQKLLDQREHPWAFDLAMGFVGFMLKFYLVICTLVLILLYIASRKPRVRQTVVIHGETQGREVRGVIDTPEALAALREATGTRDAIPAIDFRRHIWLYANYPLTIVDYVRTMNDDRVLLVTADQQRQGDAIYLWRLRRIPIDQVNTVIPR